MDTKTTIARLREKLRQRDQTIAELTARIEELLERIAVLEKNSANSSKPPSSDIVKPPKAPKSKGKGRNVMSFLRDAIFSFLHGLSPPRLLPEPAAK